jgi:hypothetical protein
MRSLHIDSDETYNVTFQRQFMTKNPTIQNYPADEHFAAVLHAQEPSERMSASEDSGPFMVCQMCGDLWQSASAFLRDALVLFVGYQQASVNSVGVLLFSHLRCGTTLSLPADALAQFSRGPVLRDSCAPRGRWDDDYCLARKGNRVCPPQCPCAYVAEITRLIWGWSKERLM